MDIDQKIAHAFYQSENELDRIEDDILMEDDRLNKMNTALEQIEQEVNNYEAVIQQLSSFQIGEYTSEINDLSHAGYTQDELGLLKMNLLSIDDKLSRIESLAKTVRNMNNSK